LEQTQSTSLRRTRNQECRDEYFKIVQTWDNGKFEEIDLDRRVWSSPNYLLANNFTGVSEPTIKIEET